MGFIAGVVCPSLHPPILLAHHHHTNPPQKAGGVSLTLSLTYLALLTHTRNRQAQSTILRAQASAIDELIPPDPSLPPSARRRNATVLLPDGTYRPRSSLEQYRREALAAATDAPDASFVDKAKTKWNSEVLAAVHWAQQKDWGAVRAEAEDGVARLLGVELSRERVPVEEEAYHLPPARAGEPAPHRVSDALHQARDRTVVMARAMRDEAREVVADARAMVATGVGKAHEMVERGKAAVHLAEEKAEARAEAKLLHVSDIEKALAERFDSARREERMKRSVEDVLKERYIPMDRRDNSELRLI
jgi:altered-inheritance-of-mitochondria protein 5